MYNALLFIVAGFTGSVAGYLAITIFIRCKNRVIESNRERASSTSSTSSSISVHLLDDTSGVV
tara:strand:- start:1826 stop:2014 length:189 start_codon:yes stop_codon:yes gene_type:complete